MSFYSKNENRIKLIEVRYKSKFLNVYEVMYKNKLNQDKKWIVASRKNKKDCTDLLNKDREFGADAVLIVGMNKQADTDRLVLIKEYRVPINDYIYSLPAGLIDKDEDIYESAIREMKEETGLDLYDINKDLTVENSYASVGMSDESLAIVYGKVRGNISKDYQEISEDIDTILVTREEARQIMDSNSPIDIKALLVLRDFVGDNICSHI